MTHYLQRKIVSEKRCVASAEWINNVALVYLNVTKAKATKLILFYFIFNYSNICILLTRKLTLLTLQMQDALTSHRW